MHLYLLLLLLLLLLSHIQRIGCQPEKTILHGGQSRSWSAEEGKKEKGKVWQRPPPPTPTPPPQPPPLCDGVLHSLLFLLFIWCPYNMAINVNVQYNGGFLPDIILVTQRYLHRGTCFNAMKRFCICSL